MPLIPKFVTGQKVVIVYSVDITSLYFYEVRVRAAPNCPHSPATLKVLPGLEEPSLAHPRNSHAGPGASSPGIASPAFPFYRGMPWGISAACHCKQELWLFSISESHYGFPRALLWKEGTHCSLSCRINGGMVGQ